MLYRLVCVRFPAVPIIPAEHHEENQEERRRAWLRREVEQMPHMLPWARSTRWLLTVAAAISTGLSSSSASASLLNVPVAPTGLVVAGVSCPEFYLSWTDNSTNETAFVVWRTTGAGDWTRIAVLA